MQHISFLLVVALAIGGEGFAPAGKSTTRQSRKESIGQKLFSSSSESPECSNSLLQRRQALASMATMSFGIMAFQQPALAVPMVSVDEFAIILRDSPLSVSVVEFSGPRSENVVVKLVDGTTFGI